MLVSCITVHGRDDGIHSRSIWSTGKDGILQAFWQLFGCFVLKIIMTAANQDSHEDDKFFESVHLGITIFIQILEDFIISILVLSHLQKKRSRPEPQSTITCIPTSSMWGMRTVPGRWGVIGGYEDGEGPGGQDVWAGAEVPRFAQRRAEELRGGLMAAAAPHRELRGSAELCSLWQRQGPRERHGAGRGGAGKGVRERVCTRGRWAWNSLPRAVSTAPRAGAQGVFGLRSQTQGLDFGWCCVEPGVVLRDPRWSIPTQDILWSSVPTAHNM